MMYGFAAIFRNGGWSGFDGEPDVAPVVLAGELGGFDGEGESVPMVLDRVAIDQGLERDGRAVKVDVRGGRDVGGAETYDLMVVLEWRMLEPADEDEPLAKGGE